jgi:hypothetical protein
MPQRSRVIIEAYLDPVEPKIHQELQPVWLIRFVVWLLPLGAAGAKGQGPHSAPAPTRPQSMWLGIDSAAARDHSSVSKGTLKRMAQVTLRLLPPDA